ncbi:MAG: lactate racemase domain-containing protein [Bacillota bacterium]
MPYGEGSLSMEAGPEDLIGLAEPREPLVAAADQEGEISRAVSCPIGCPRLCDMVKRGQRVAVAISDYSRHTPTKLILPVVLEELGAAGIRDEDVTVVVATGLHRPTRRDELEHMLGPALLSRLRVLNHDPDMHEGLVRLGVTSRGTPVVLDWPRPPLESTPRACMNCV